MTEDPVPLLALWLDWREEEARHSALQLAAVATQERDPGSPAPDWLRRRAEFHWKRRQRSRLALEHSNIDKDSWEGFYRALDMLAPSDLDSTKDEPAYRFGGWLKRFNMSMKGKNSLRMWGRAANDWIDTESPVLRRIGKRIADNVDPKTGEMREKTDQEPDSERKREH